VEAVRVIPNVAFALRIHEQGDGSRGAIQDPVRSKVEVDLPGGELRSYHALYSRMSEQTANHARGWLWYPWIADAEKAFFRYGEEGYDRSETIVLSQLETGAKTAALVHQGVSFRVEGNHVITSHGNTIVYPKPRGQLFWVTPDGVSHMANRVPASKATFSVLLVFGSRFAFTAGTMYAMPGDDATQIEFTIDAAFVSANPNLLPWIIF